MYIELSQQEQERNSYRTHWQTSPIIVRMFKYDRVAVLAPMKKMPLSLLSQRGFIPFVSFTLFGQRGVLLRVHLLENPLWL